VKKSKAHLPYFAFCKQFFFHPYKRHFWSFEDTSNYTMVEILLHSRMDIVGLDYSDNGRSCISHPDGCGKEVEVDMIVTLKCTEAVFTEEHIKITKKVEYKGLTVLELKNILTNEFQINKISNKKKDWLVSKLLELRGEPDVDDEITEIKTWKERTVEVYTVPTGSSPACKIGYIARHNVNMFGEALDGVYAKILKLRGQSEWKAERLESYRNGGAALIETVRMTFE
jgi:hypothetical protein